jgi:peroxiredoxin-like protein
VTEQKAAEAKTLLDADEVAADEWANLRHSHTGAIMQDLPHRYSVAAIAKAEGEVSVESGALPSLATAPPAEFGGPGDQWSPETLLVASVADCFILTFRAVARASKLPWETLRCDVEATLDKVDRVAQFTEFLVRASLRVPAGTDEAKANRLLARAEQSCLITNSLKGASHLEAEIEIS